MASALVAQESKTDEAQVDQPRDDGPGLVQTAGQRSTRARFIPEHAGQDAKAQKRESQGERDAVDTVEGFEGGELKAAGDGSAALQASVLEEKEETGERFYRRERRVGSLSRRFAIPSTLLMN